MIKDTQDKFILERYQNLIVTKNPG